MSSLADPATSRKADAPPTADPRRAFRPDIEGLRALAVLVVLAFHADIPGFTGGYVGVDVFFVISGYLITGLLLREALATGRVRLAEFYSRRARRLLPSAGLVLAAVSLAALVLIGPLSRTDVYHDILAAALSVSNWRFISEQTNYLAAGRDPSPLLHFWSLAVEEQFYLLWAPLFALLAWLFRRGGAERTPARRHRRNRRLRGTLAVLVAVTTAVSLLLCLRWSQDSVSLAYLGTPSRAWQFGVGALLALLPTGLRLPAALRRCCGWAGLAAILLATVWYTAATPYPGSAALLPTLGAAAVLAAGLPGPGDDGQLSYSAARLLGTRAPRALGRLSYNLYLWHWPVLVLADDWTGRTLPWPVKAALVLASALPAAATLRWVERPLRRSPVVTELPRRGLSLGLTAIAVPVVLALVAGTGTLHTLGSAAPVASAGLPAGAVTGGSLLVGGAKAAGSGPVIPTPIQARNDYPPDGDCEVAPAAVSSPPCEFGDLSSSHRIVLLGDSHAGQWFSAMLGIAATRHWGLEELVKQGCPLPQLSVVNPQLGHTYTECDSWRTNTVARLRSEPKPDLIVIASLNRYTDNQSLLLNAWNRTLAPLRALGVPIVYLTDTPVPGLDVPACVSDHPGDLGLCAVPRSQALWPDPLSAAIAAGREPGVHQVSVNDVLCPGSGSDCPAVLDRVLLYRDTAHLTNAAVVILTDRLQQLLSAQGLLGDGWTTLLEDGFQGPAGSRPNPALWEYDTGTCYQGCPAPHWGTGEVETMTDSTANVRLDGHGDLEIVPTRGGGPSGAWSSGRIESRGSSFAAPPGGILRISATIALPDVSGPAATGYWPAFWTLGAGLRPSFSSWPGVGELDAMESVDGRPSVFGTMHCGITPGGPCDEPTGLGSGEHPCAACVQGFHTYTVEVDRSTSPEQVRWYLDGTLYHEVTAAQMDAATWDDAVHHGVFLILDVAVGGSFPGVYGGAVPTGATQPGHPMLVRNVTVSARAGN
ncbi:acyltransferase family protein [Streptacidiphilus sp. P02-A3a]|uniref:acyltransferase family protein n=1 Tax=Streptacidiphilus sp. P02-A3a TaxID=2704468 RepID=UPI0015F981C1|nr:acyltransferase family protein [Streptacidiphilus sp. P02-A3a]QMU71116.1 acyltransferase family protein [Streptacidiphilus sp. P02-A3a]